MIEARLWLLLAFEDAEVTVETVGLERIQFRGEMSKGIAPHRSSVSSRQSPVGNHRSLVPVTSPGVKAQYMTAIGDWRLLTDDWRLLFSLSSHEKQRHPRQ